MNLTMKKGLLILITAILLTAMLCGCGASPANSSGEPKLRFPDKVVAKADDTQIDLSKLNHEGVAEAAELLRQMPELKEIDLGTDGAWAENAAETTRDLTWEDLFTLQNAAPQAELLYCFRFCGRDFSTADEEMDLSNCRMVDDGGAVREILPLMKNCRYLNMDSCGVSDEAMMEIRDEFPEIKVVWRAGSGTAFSCRTDAKELDLSELSHCDVANTAAMLKLLPELESVDLGSDGAWTGNPPELTQETASEERPAEATRDLTWEDLHTLQDAAPQAQFLYRFRFYGRDFTTTDEEMDLNHSPMTDNGEAVREILPLMKNCRYLDMDSCGVPSETMAEIRDAYPEMDVVWRVWFGYGLCCRTDIELMVNSSGTAGMQDETHRS